MSSVISWEELLGLPLDRALEKLQAKGREAAVAETCAPRREPISGATLRVIRVREADGCVQLTVSAFMDGDPRKV